MFYKGYLQNCARAVALATALCLAVPASSAQFSVDYRGVDINEFISTVGKGLKKTLVVDPAVRGRITVRSYDPLNEEQYWHFFLSVLEVYGFAVVEMENGVLKVVRDKDAKTAAIPVVDEDNPGVGDEMVTQVVPVQNVSVRDLAPLLRQLNDNAGGGNVVHYDPSNVIMLTGRAAVVNRLVEVIKRVDRAGDEEVEIVPLNHASATEVVRIVESLKRQDSGAKGASSLQQPRVVADERTNSVVLTGEAKGRERYRTLIERLDRELESTGNTQVYYLRYANAKDLVDVLEGASRTLVAEEQATNKQKTGQRTISIKAHEDTNALVITAEPSMQRSLENIIRQLDIRRAQVHVEAIIVELLDLEGAELGVNWASASLGAAQLTNAKVGLADLAVGLVDGEGDFNPDIDTLGSILQNINGLFVGSVGSDWAALVQALNTTTASNILSTPSITTLDNKEASFVVGQDVPTITGTTLGDGNSNPFQTIKREEVGIKLKVRPQINEGNSVQLEIEQEVSSLAGTGAAADVIINKRQLTTTVLVEDQSTLVLGGLIDDDVQESISKVPVLGDIPLVGTLFKSRSTKSTKRNLLIFIRPTIVRDDVMMAQLSQRKYSYLRAEQLERYSRGVNLLPSRPQPVMPEWDESLAIPPSFDDYMLDSYE